jgi:hypothetical protein
MTEEEKAIQATLTLAECQSVAREARLRCELAQRIRAAILKLPMATPRALL